MQTNTHSKKNWLKIEDGMKYLIGWKRKKAGIPIQHPFNILLGALAIATRICFFGSHP
jgi:hypothetical protein